MLSFLNSLYIARVAMCIFRLNFKLHDILMYSLSVGSCVYHRITGYLGKRMETYVEGIILELI